MASDRNRDGLRRSHEPGDFGVELFGEIAGRFRGQGIEEVFRQASETFRAGAEKFDILA